MNLARALQFKPGRSLTEEAKPVIKLVLLFPPLIVLGAALAIYAESPLLIIPFIGAMVLTSFAALEYALYLLVAFLPFSFRFIFSYGTEMQVPTEPLLAIMTAALILRWIIMGRRGVHFRFPFRYPMLMYGASLCLSMISSGRLYTTAKGSLRAVAYMMLAFIVFNVITDKKRLRNLFIISIIPAIAAVGWTLVFLIDRLEIWRWSSAYEGLPFTSYSHYGAFVAVILLILLSRMIFDKGRYDRVGWTIMLGFFFVAMCFSFSRGAWLSLIVAAVFLLLQKSTGVQHKKILMVVGGIVLFVVLLSMPYVSRLIISRAKTLASFGYGANRERILRWGTAIVMFLRHPITGAGYGSFAFTYISDPAIVGTHLSQYKMGAHNEYLQTLAETGLIGFSALIWIIISFFLYGLRLSKKLLSMLDNSTFSIQHPASSIQHPASSISFYRSLVIGVMAAELSLLMHFMVNNMIQADIIGVPFWLLMGILPAIGNIVEKENKYEKSVRPGMRKEKAPDRKCGSNRR